MSIRTSIGEFSATEFVKKCNEKSLPKNLVVFGNLYLDGSKTLLALPEGLFVEESLYLAGCDTIQALPNELTIKDNLDIWGCPLIKTLPNDLKVKKILYVNISFIKKYPFKELPKILHLPFTEEIKSLIRERLSNGH